MGARLCPPRTSRSGRDNSEAPGGLRGVPCANPLRAGKPGSRPGGTPEEISRGQVRPSGRRPRKRCRLAPCPSGASKKQARDDECWRKSSGENAAKNFFDAPLGHGLFGFATGGRARCAGLPPANFLRGPSVTKNKAVITIFWSSARGQGRAKIPARRTSRSRLAAGDASDANGCPRGFGAAAAGPRRTQPRFSGRCLTRRGRCLVSRVPNTGRWFFLHELCR